MHGLNVYLARLWQAVGQWSSISPHTRAYLYTAYRSHYDYCFANPVPRGNRWFESANVNLDQVNWSDKNARAASGPSRGTASEAYASQRRFGLVCLPVSFFQYYIPNEDRDGKIVIVGNQARGWHDEQYHVDRKASTAMGYSFGECSHMLSRKRTQTSSSPKQNAPVKW